jgi:hypothetical protein
VRRYQSEYADTDSEVGVIDAGDVDVTPLARAEEAFTIIEEDAAYQFAS